MEEITEWNNILEEPILALDEGWDWRMYFRGSPRLISEKEIEAVILTAISGKVYEVEYNLKEITLKELKENG